MDTYDKIMTELRAMVGKGKRFETPAALADLCDADPAFVHKHLQGKIKGDKIRPLLDFFYKAGLSMTFSDERSPVMQRMGTNAPREAVKGDGLAEIEVMGVAGAGPAQENCHLEPMESILILQKYMYPGLFAFKIKGDSMEPTLMDGSIVGVIPLDGDLQEGSVYLVMIPYFGIVAKRLFFGRDGKLSLKSDKEGIEPIPLDTNEYENVIKGKVAWVWQHLP